MQEVRKAPTERLFIGVPVPQDVSAAILAQLPGELPGRVVPLAKWHFTLRFLGHVTEQQRDQIVRVFSIAALGERFRIRFDALGAFPNPRRARVLWVGVADGSAELERLAREVEHVVRGAGFEGERRPFKPHLTLSRVDPPASVASVIAAGQTVTGFMDVAEVILFRSHVGRGPSRYEALHVMPLI